MKKITYVVMVAMLVVGLLLTAYAQKTAAAPTPTRAPTPRLTPQYGGVLKLIYATKPSTLGYPPVLGSTDLITVSPCIETLVGLDAQGHFVPTRLTTAMAISPEGKTWIFTLRKRVKFHDGTDWDAGAAKWNMDSQLAAKQSGTEYWTSVDIVDDYTVRLNLKQYDSTLLNNLYNLLGLMISPTAVQKNGKEWAYTHPVGAGPFKFKSFERDANVKYERFEDYWGGKPYLDGIEYYFIEDGVVASIALQRGEVNAICNSKLPVVVRELAAKGFEVISRVQILIVSLMPDSIHPDSILAKEKVREAVEYAIDRDKVAQVIGYGYYRKVNQFCPSTSPSFNPDILPRSYNPSKAKQLLAEAGYPNGFKTKIIAQTSDNKDLLTALQGYLQAVGIDCQVELTTAPVYNGYKAGTEWKDSFLFRSIALWEPYSNTIGSLFGEIRRHMAVKRPPRFEELYNKLVGEVDGKKALGLSKQIVKLMYDDATVVPLYTITQPYVLDKSVNDSGFQSTVATQFWTPEKTWLSK